MVSKEELADGVIAALNAHDAKKLGTYLTEDVEYWEVTLPEAIQGREAVEEYFRLSWESFPDSNMKSVNRVQSGDWFADELEWTGTNTGPIVLSEQTIPATGKSAKAWFVAVGKTSGDKVSEMRGYYDQVSFLAQLGLMDQPGSE